MSDSETLTAPASVAPAQKKKYRAIPLNKWVLVRPVHIEEELSEGAHGASVLKPGESSPLNPGIKSQRGYVYACAEGVPLEVGDLIVFTGFAMANKDAAELTGIDDIKLIRFEEVFVLFEEE